MNRRFGGFRSGVLAAALLITAAGFPRARAADQTPAARAGETRGEVVASALGWVDVSGGIRRLGVRTEGVVQSVLVKEGDRVESGAALLRLEDRLAAIQVRSAEIELERQRREQATLAAQLQRAREAAARLEPLVKQQAESVDELRQARAHVADLEAQAEVAGLDQRAAALRKELAEDRLAQQELRAPARGEVLRVLAHPGDAVAPGNVLVWLAAAGPPIVRAELDERLFRRVKPGMRAVIVPEYDDTKSYGASVARLARLVGPVQALPEIKTGPKDDRVVECVLDLESDELLIGQRVLVRILGGP